MRGIFLTLILLIFIFLTLKKEVKSEFTDLLRLHGKSQVSDSVSKNTDMSHMTTH